MSQIYRDDVIWVDWVFGSYLSRHLFRFVICHDFGRVILIYPHTRCPSCSPCEAATPEKDVNFGLTKILEVKSMTLGMARTSMAVFLVFFLVGLMWRVMH